MNRQIAPYTENILDAPLNEPVCWCSKVSKQMILEAIKNGANNIGSIRQTTGACTVGRCKLLSPRERCCSKEILLLLDADVSA
ncbi:MAG: (2Fe-2S)-binding protein [Desulfuromonadales bacterium]